MSLLITAMAATWLGFAEPTAPAGRESAEALPLVREYPAPGLEMELSGLAPHPTDATAYLVLANRRPTYRAGQTPLLPEAYRGKLLVVDRESGRVKEAVPLTDGDYGGLAVGDGHLFAVHLNPPEIVKFDLASRRVLARFPIDGQAGGLDFDRRRGLLIAQVFTGVPHLSVLDARTGALKETLWSDESAMGLAKVRGDWLCTWASGFGEGAFSEMRLLDEATGRVKGRFELKGLYSSMAPIDPAVDGCDGVICLVKTDSRRGTVVVRVHRYEGPGFPWRRVDDE